MRIVVATAIVALVVLAAGCGEEETTTAPTAPEAGNPEETTGASSNKGNERVKIERIGQKEAVSIGVRNDAPEAVLHEFFTSGNPDLVCGELSTGDLLSSAYGDETGCRRAQVPAAVPDAIEIERLDASGAEAEAVVVPDGGPNDGIETTVTLVDDGRWRVDSLEADVPAGP